jgi:arylsulfatase A-like enzyme
MGKRTILITVDALRADHLGQYGYDRDTMPALDRLTKNGTVFSHAFANGPYTRVSIPSFHTSKLLGYEKSEQSTTIASELSSEGVLTSVVGTNTGWASYEGDFGFDDYFDIRYHSSHENSKSVSDSPGIVSRIGDVLEKYPPLHKTGKKTYQSYKGIKNRFQTRNLYNAYPSASDVTDYVTDWIEDRGDKEYFLWVHYMDAHTPFGLHDSNPKYSPKVSDQKNEELVNKMYQSPSEVTVKEYKILKDMYDSNLRYCSRQLNRLFDTLENKNLWGDTNIIFSSDHGEEFYEHDMFFHHNFPYDELIHVPLLTTGPDVPDNKISEQRELLDLGPTILDFHDVQSPESFDGKNLFEGKDRDVIAVGSHEYDGQVVARRYNDWKYIWTEDNEYLYNLQKDPGEDINVINENIETRDIFRQAIPKDIFDAPPEELRDPDDEVDKSRLEALGYID